MARYREWDLACKVYVGNLGSSASKHEIESAFGKYGPLRNVWVARNPPGFAFVEFEDKRDAEDACRSLDGAKCCGTRIRVEMSSGRTRRDDRSRRPRRSYRASSSMILCVSNFRHRSSYNQPSTSSSTTIKPSASIKSTNKPHIYSVLHLPKNLLLLPT
uniref:Putative rna recognition motif in serine/arginine-rich splicing factor 3 n=1 Tax=Culex tarsalis TaxID=7177 RepID=A0A1Q3F7Z2_CULTA